MIVKQLTEQSFKPVTITVETLDEFKAITRITQAYEYEGDTPQIHRFSIDLYNYLDGIYAL